MNKAQNKKQITVQKQTIVKDGHTKAELVKESVKRSEFRALQMIVNYKQTHAQK